MASVPWPGPRRSIEALAAEHGRAAVVKACLDLLRGSDVDPRIIHGLGGPPARWAIEGGPSGPDYWLRVWALRGLLWLWDDSATRSVVNALRNEAWRVREMAAKVCARHKLDAAMPDLLKMRDDPAPRVRSAAQRAIERITG